MRKAFVVLAALALVASSFGPAIANHLFVESSDIAEFAIRNGDLGTNSVNARTIAANSVGGSELAAHAVGTSEVSPFLRSLLVWQTVPSGRTIRGAVGADYDNGDATGCPCDWGIDVSFPVKAANALSDADVFINVTGQQQDAGQTPATTTDTSVGCSGSPSNPTAPSGKVCIYVSGADNATDLSGYSVLFGTGASPYGFKLKWAATGSGDTFVDAIWAYTAP